MCWCLCYCIARITLRPLWYGAVSLPDILIVAQGNHKHCSLVLAEASMCRGLIERNITAVAEGRRTKNAVLAEAIDAFRIDYQAAAAQQCAPASPPSPGHHFSIIYIVHGLHTAQVACRPLACSRQLPWTHIAAGNHAFLQHEHYQPWACMALGSVDSGNILPAAGTEDTLVASDDHLPRRSHWLLSSHPSPQAYIYTCTEAPRHP